MPHDTVYITDVENAILQIFVKHGVMESSKIILALEELISKLREDLKVRLKRVKSSPNNPALRVDGKFMEGTLLDMPKVGRSLHFCHNQGFSYIVTSPVKSFTRDGSKWTIETMNSIYEMKNGWEER